MKIEQSQARVCHIEPFVIELLETDENTEVNTAAHRSDADVHGEDIVTFPKSTHEQDEEAIHQCQDPGDPEEQELKRSDDDHDLIHVRSERL